MKTSQNGSFCFFFHSFVQQPPWQTFWLWFVNETQVAFFKTLLNVLLTSCHLVYLTYPPTQHINYAQKLSNSRLSKYLKTIMYFYKTHLLTYHSLLQCIIINFYCFFRLIWFQIYSKCNKGKEIWYQEAFVKTAHVSYTLSFLPVQVLCGFKTERKVLTKVNVFWLKFSRCTHTN